MNWWLNLWSESFIVVKVVIIFLFIVFMVNRFQSTFRLMGSGKAIIIKAHLLNLIYFVVLITVILYVFRIFI